MHVLALEGVNFMSLRILCITSAHLVPDDLNPYKVLRKIKIYLVPQVLDQQLCRAFHQ